MLPSVRQGPDNMGSPALPDDFEIAPGHRVRGWKSLSLDETDPAAADWSKAISILDARIRRRFIEPAQLLIDAENGKSRGTNGFAVLAIDFLLIETIQGFRSGLTDHTGQSGRLFAGFLMDWPGFTACIPPTKKAADLAKSVYTQGRCALHHTGSTDRIVVRKSGKMFVFHDDKRIEINRSLLHQQLTKAFDAYLAALKEPEHVELRKNFKIKMKKICT